MVLVRALELRGNPSTDMLGWKHVDHASRVAESWNQSMSRDTRSAEDGVERSPAGHVRLAFVDPALG